MQRDWIYLKRTTTIEQQTIQQSNSLSATDTTTPYYLNTTGRIFALITAMRPRQWTKNLALFVGLVFAQQLFSLTSFERASVAFIVFCLASSSVYLFNDLLDLERDRQHPTKSKRPLATGDLPISWAIVTIGILILGCAGLTLLIFSIPIQQTDIFASLGVAYVLFPLSFVSYLLLMALYSVR